MKKMHILIMILSIVFEFQLEAIDFQFESVMLRRTDKGVVMPDSIMQRLLDARLYKAVEEGSIERVRSCLNGGANVNAKCYELNSCFITDDSPLTMAAPRGNVEIVKLLLSSGAEINYCASSGLALIRAINWLRFDESMVPVIKLLIAMKADVNAQNEFDKTALSECANLNDMYAIRIAFRLLLAGADKLVGGRFGMSIVKQARENNRYALAGLIETYPHGTLQGYILFSIAKDLLGDDETKKSAAQKHIDELSQNENDLISKRYLGLLHALIGNESSNVLADAAAYAALDFTFQQQASNEKARENSRAFF